VSWGAFAGGLAGGAASFFGSREANRANAGMTREQMDWEQRMSESAHQREVNDLIKAGLNPILSAGGPGASTPGAPGFVGAKSETEGIATSARDAWRLKNEARILKAQADKAEAEAKAAKKTAAVGDVAPTGIRAVGDIVNPLLLKSAEGWKQIQRFMFSPKSQVREDFGSFLKGLNPPAWKMERAGRPID